MSTIISRTDLARNTREIIEQARSGAPVVIASHGHEQVVMLDAFDYRLLIAMARCGTGQPRSEDDAITQVIRQYLDESISLAKAAELLELSRFVLMERFERLGLPLRTGPTSLEDAQNEVDAARQAKTVRS
jgi:prevent-host-death family protein